MAIHTQWLNTSTLKKIKINKGGNPLFLWPAICQNKSRRHGHFKMFRYTSNPNKAHFFIQTKGHNAGQPLKKQIPNCIGIQVNEQLLVPDYFYYLVLNLFLSGKFKNKIKGSVIPYIRQSDITEAILEFMLNSKR